jgi:Cu2+-containing amine oxidase
MVQTKVLSESEESELAVLAQDQPKSTKALQALIDKIKARAVQIVLDDARVAARIRGKRSRVIASDLTEDESKDSGENGTRRAEVGIYDYDDDVMIVPIVDLRRGTVTVIEERKGYHPALAADEIEEAKNFALAQPEFQSLKNHSGLEIAAYPARAAAIPSHQGYGHRCVTLYFWSGGKQSERISQAVVDLSARKLIPGDAEGEPFIDR